MPVGADDFREGLRMCRNLSRIKSLLKKQGLAQQLGMKAGLHKSLDAKTALQYLKQAVELAGYRMEKRY